jgi:hypothetical protein
MMQDFLAPEHQLFIIAGILDLLILVYAFSLARKMGGSGYLPRMVIFGAIGVFVLGIHHIMEIFFTEGIMNVVSEGIETVSLLFMLLAVYQLYKLAQED